MNTTDVPLLSCKTQENNNYASDMLHHPGKQQLCLRHTPPLRNTEAVPRWWCNIQEYTHTIRQIPSGWVKGPHEVMASKRPPPVFNISHLSEGVYHCNTITHNKQAPSRPPPSVHRSSSPRTPGETCRCPPHCLICQPVIGRGGNILLGFNHINLLVVITLVFGHKKKVHHDRFYR